MCISLKTLEEKILYLMSWRNWKINELSQLLDRSPGCIRAALSDLRRDGKIDYCVQLSSDMRSKTFMLVI